MSGARSQTSGVAPGDRVLDIGTGPGYLALAAARLVRPDGFAVGIDASPEMIARARELAAREGSSVEYRVADFASPAVQGAHHVAAQVRGNRPETDGSLGRLLWHAGCRGITSGRLLHGMLAGARGEKL